MFSFQVGSLFERWFRKRVENFVCRLWHFMMELVLNWLVEGCLNSLLGITWILVGLWLAWMFGN